MRACSLALMLMAAPVTADGVLDYENAYEACALCHGLFGDSRRAKFPKLAGQDPVYLEAQILAFLSGQRRNDGGQMVAVVTELDAADIPVVVDWFATQDPPTPAPPPQGEEGALLYILGECGSCHDSRTGVPLLTAQHPAYLAKQMRDFRAGLRPVSTRAKTAAMMALSEAEIDTLAAWLGAQPREPHDG
ncbi:hypothetical protein AB0T83_09040 [Fluviibacterium sp. DFM31]|uniref:Cytochrome c domain-containing protein n=1 Tax=Meridianimarinicoccus marinus TaxID=3231483 RepID=A0ABV3L5V6_9RHOB